MTDTREPDSHSPHKPLTPAAVRTRLVAAMSSLVVVDIAITSIFVAKTTGSAGLLLNQVLPASLLMLGLVNGLGGWLLARPIHGYLAGRGVPPERVAARVRRLPRLAAAWVFVVTLTYTSLLFSQGVYVADTTALTALPLRDIVAAGTVFTLVYGIYYSFFTYFLVADFQLSLRARLHAHHGLDVAPAGGRLVVTLVGVFFVVTVVPLALFMLDATIFQDVRAAQGVNIADAMLLDGLSTAVVLAVALIFVTRAFVRPMRALNRRLVALRGGDLTVRAPVMRDDEIGQVMATFNEMAGSLRERDTRLQDQLGQIAQLQQETERAFDTAIELLARAAELHDDVTGNHIARVGQYAEALARRRGEPETWCRELARAAKLHDVGKMSVDAAVLKKTGELSEAEWAEIKRHCELGYAILKGEERLAMAADVALNHHEKWDGTGYPNGKSGEEIPLAARIVTIADVYDALRSPRPYKPGFSHETAVRVITRGDDRLDPERHFDPNLVAVFKTYHHDFARIWSSQAPPAAVA